MRLAAPHPAIERVLYLPEPIFGDSERLTANMDLLRSMDNTVYTYVRRKNKRKHLQLQVNVSRSQALLLRSFIESYYSSLLEITDHLGKLWIGYFMTNPFEFETTGLRSAQGFAEQTIVLDFEGELF